MLTNINWIGAASAEDFKSFLEKRLKLDQPEVTKRLDKGYGTYFLVETAEDRYLFGNFGFLKRESSGELVEDVERTVANPIFLQEYLAFVRANNIRNGKPKTVNNKTYLDYANEVIYSYLDEISQQVVD